MVTSSRLRIKRGWYVYVDSSCPIHQTCISGANTDKLARLESNPCKERVNFGVHLWWTGWPSRGGFNILAVIKRANELFASDVFDFRVNDIARLEIVFVSRWFFIETNISSQLDGRNRILPLLFSLTISSFFWLWIYSYHLYKKALTEEDLFRFIQFIKGNFNMTKCCGRRDI